MAFSSQEGTPNEGSAAIVHSRSVPEPQDIDGVPYVPTGRPEPALRRVRWDRGRPGHDRSQPHPARLGLPGRQIARRPSRTDIRGTLVRRGAGASPRALLGTSLMWTALRAGPSASSRRGRTDRPSSSAPVSERCSSATPRASPLGPVSGFGLAVGPPMHAGGGWLPDPRAATGPVAAGPRPWVLSPGHPPIVTGSGHMRWPTGHRGSPSRPASSTRRDPTEGEQGRIWRVEDDLGD